MFTNDIINGNVKNSEMDENEQLYASYVRKMGKTYSVTGENDVAGRMEETLSMINNNEINPYENENYDMFSVPQQPQQQEIPQQEAPQQEMPQPENPPIIASATEEDFRNAREQANARQQAQKNRRQQDSRKKAGSSGRKTQGTNSNANGGNQSTQSPIITGASWSDVQAERDNPNNNKK